MPQATGLVAELEAKYGKDATEITLVPGRGGVFDVTVDGELVYSKHQEQGFPRYGQVPQAIDRKRLSG